MKIFGYVLLSLLLGSSFTSKFASADQGLSNASRQLSSEWADITFTQSKDEQSQLYKALSQRSADAADRHPDDAQLLTWVGIIHSSYAGSIKGLGALKVVKKAKRYFEKAMALDSEALSGGARTSLGSLYQHVPGWPIGFGDKKKAEQYLALSAQRHPDNIDALFFFAQFLDAQNRAAEAIKVYEQALSLPSHLYSTTIYDGRVLQIQNALSSLNAKRTTRLNN